MKSFSTIGNSALHTIFQVFITRHFVNPHLVLFKIWAFPISPSLHLIHCFCHFHRYNRLFLCVVTHILIVLILAINYLVNLDFGCCSSSFEVTCYKLLPDPLEVPSAHISETTSSFCRFYHLSIWELNLELVHIPGNCTTQFSNNSGHGQDPALGFIAVPGDHNFSCTCHHPCFHHASCQTHWHVSSFASSILDRLMPSPNIWPYNF